MFVKGNSFVKTRRRRMLQSDLAQHSLSDFVSVFTASSCQTSSQLSNRPAEFTWTMFLGYASFRKEQRLADSNQNCTGFSTRSRLGYP